MIPRYGASVGQPGTLVCCLSRYVVSCHSAPPPYARSGTTPLFGTNPKREQLKPDDPVLLQLKYSILTSIAELETEERDRDSDESAA